MCNSEQGKDMAGTKKSSQKGGTSKLTKTSKKGQVELKEDELGKVAGGSLNFTLKLK